MLMKKILFYLLAVLLITACNSKSNNASNDSETATVTEDSGGAKTQGYNKGYQDGYDDGYGWKAYMVGYNHANSYQTSDAYNAYLNGYKEGYDQGYKEGEEAIKAEREKEKLRDWHNWEKEDVDGIYICLEGVTDEDEARYIANERYDGEYVEEWGDYYAKVSQRIDNYNITLGQRISSRFYSIRGRDLYIRFKWISPDVSSGDEGVLDYKGTFNYFYKKPMVFNKHSVEIETSTNNRSQPKLIGWLLLSYS